MTKFDPDAFNTSTARTSLKTVLTYAKALRGGTLNPKVNAWYAGRHFADAITSICRIKCDTSREYYITVWERVGRIIDREL